MTNRTEYALLLSLAGLALILVLWALQMLPDLPPSLY